MFITSVTSCSGIIESLSTVPIHLQTMDTRRRSVLEDNVSGLNCLEIRDFYACKIPGYLKENLTRSTRGEKRVLDDEDDVIGSLQTIVGSTLSVEECLSFDSSTDIHSDIGQLVLKHPIDWQVRLTGTTVQIPLDYLYDSIYNEVYKTYVTCDCRGRSLRNRQCSSTWKSCGTSEICVTKNLLTSGNKNCFWNTPDQIDRVNFCASLRLENFDIIKIYKVGSVKKYYTNWEVVKDDITGHKVEKFEKVIAGETEELEGITFGIHGIYNFDFDLPNYLVQFGDEWYLTDNVNDINQRDVNKLGYAQKIHNRWSYSETQLKNAWSVNNEKCEAEVNTGLHSEMSHARHLLTATNTIDYITKSVGDGRVENEFLYIDVRNTDLRVSSSIILENTNIVFEYFFAQVEDVICNDTFKENNADNIYELECIAKNPDQDSFTNVMFYLDGVLIYKYRTEVKKEEDITFTINLPRSDKIVKYELCYYKIEEGKFCTDFSMNPQKKDVVWHDMIIESVAVNDTIKEPVEWNWDWGSPFFGNILQSIEEFFKDPFGITGWIWWVVGIIVVILIVGVIVFVVINKRSAEFVGGGGDTTIINNTSVPLIPSAQVGYERMLKTHVSMETMSSDDF